MLAQTNSNLTGSQKSRRPVHRRRNPAAKVGQKSGRTLQVVEADHLYRAVHVTVGDADQGGGDAVAGQLDGVGVGPGRTWGPADLDRDLQAAGGLAQLL